MSDIGNATRRRNSSEEFGRDVSSTLTFPAPETTDSFATPKASAQIRVGTPSRATFSPTLPGIPVEALHGILERLHTVDIVRLSMVCRRLQKRSDGFLQLRPTVESRRKTQYLAITSLILARAHGALHIGSWNARRAIPPSQENAKASLQVQVAQLTNHASLVASGVGRRFHDVSFTFDKHYSAELGTALVEAEGWTCLNLHVAHYNELDTFLWQLMEVQAHEHSPSRKLNIVFDKALHFTAVPPEVCTLLTALPGSGVKLQLNGLTFNGAEIRHLLPVIAHNTTLEHLDLRFVDEPDAIRNLYEPLARCPNFKSLALHFVEVAKVEDFATLVDKVGILKIEDFSLNMKDLVIESGACVAGLISAPMRKLRFDAISFVKGMLAGFGDALAKSTALENLVLVGCKFWEEEEWAALVSGVATNRSLAELDVRDCKVEGGMPGEALLHAAQQCTTLKELLVSEAYEKKYADAIAALRQARPNLLVASRPGWFYAGAAPQQTNNAESDSDDDFGPALAIDEDNEVGGFVDMPSTETEEEGNEEQASVEQESAD